MRIFSVAYVLISSMQVFCDSCHLGTLTNIVEMNGFRFSKSKSSSTNLYQKSNPNSKSDGFKI